MKKEGQNSLATTVLTVTPSQHVSSPYEQASPSSKLTQESPVSDSVEGQVSDCVGGLGVGGAGVGGAFVGGAGVGGIAVGCFVVGCGVGDGVGSSVGVTVGPGVGDLVGGTAVGGALVGGMGVGGALVGEGVIARVGFDPPPEVGINTKSMMLEKDKKKRMSGSDENKRHVHTHHQYLLHDSIRGTDSIINIGVVNLGSCCRDRDDNIKISQGCVLLSIFEWFNKIANHVIEQNRH